MQVLGCETDEATGCAVSKGIGNNKCERKTNKIFIIKRKKKKDDEIKMTQVDGQFIFLRKFT